MGKLIFLIIPLIAIIAWLGRRAYVYFAGTREKDNALAELERLKSTEEFLDIQDQVDEAEIRIKQRTQTDKTENIE